MCYIDLNMDEFLSSLLPGNYWITKSMEFSKTNSSGTLWYLKKWFVYYYFIFFKKTIHEDDYIQIADNFDKFIASLDPLVQDKAKEFFYEVDIKTNFTRMNAFCDTSGTIFSSAREEAQSITEAKKFYFMYIMGIGGQSGYKKEILELIQAGTSYTEIKKIMVEKMENEGVQPSDIKIQFTDFPAAIRNERQIFFYYGLFHGSDKKDLSGFYTMTRIGRSIISATFYELVIIWEHQKLKMISQNPDTKIELGNHKVDSTLNYSAFSVHYHPYLALLKILASLQIVSKEIYQNYIARLKNYHDLNILSEDIKINPAIIENIKTKITSFNRKGDLATEDFHKEFKKYVLGISNLPLDNGTNLFSFLSEDGLKVENNIKLNFIIKCYDLIINYLDSKNLDTYKSFEKSLREYYLAQVNKTSFEYDPEITYEWHKYIISPETTIILSVAYVYCAIKNNKYDFNLSETEIKTSYRELKNILEIAGIGKQSDFVENIQRIQSELSDGLLTISYDTEEEEIPTVFDELIDESKLAEISKRTSAFNINRKRSPEVINAVRSYYRKNFEIPPNNLIQCDACNEETFMTKGQYAYLEFHHFIPFSTDNGPDHYLNLVGICPTCHRKFHHATKDTRKALYESLSMNNNMKKTLDFRINKLYEENVLDPLNIEFLKKENIISKEKYEEYMDQEVVAN